MTEEEAMSDAPIVTIQGQEVELEIPTSQAEVLAVINIGVRHPQWSAAAALGVCWPRHITWPGQARPEMLRCRFDGLVYGSNVIDSMCSAGVPLGEVIAAGIAAYELLPDLLLSPEELAAAKAFIDPHGEA